ncbi:uncharacterized protein LOC107362924 [Tetranychus urticae]|uniref:uncharacterized protein LOC107362924 n=1 Tax=Tetranychus urticae TaxID=32264 RepID=UPI00077BB6D9|nr:uncharacterized protein LOC107362924 [Tetranychus urticae]
MVKTWFESKFLRTKEPLSQPVIPVTLVFTCFVTVVFGHLSREPGLRFIQSSPSFISPEATKIEIDFKYPGFTDRAKIRYWQPSGLSYYVVFNGTHYASSNIINGKLVELCAPTMMAKNPAAFSHNSWKGFMIVHKCDSVRYGDHCVKSAFLSLFPCDVQTFFVPTISYDLKDVGTPLGIHGFGDYTYAYLALTNDRGTVSVTRACTEHWWTVPRGIIIPNYGAILKLKDCAETPTLPIFVKFFSAAQYIIVGYLDDGGSIHICVYKFAKINRQLDLSRKNCDKASQKPYLRAISAKGRNVSKCQLTDRPYSCWDSNYFNEMVYYNISKNYSATYIRFDEISVTPQNPIQDTFEFEITSPFNKWTLIIAQKNNVFIINGLEDIDQDINPVITRFNASLDYIHPQRNIIYLYHPNTFNVFIPRPIYSCNILPQHQCKLTLECDLCGLECVSQKNFKCPVWKKLAPSSVINPLILSNGVLEINFNPNGNVLNINVTLEATFNILIKINASYIPTTGRIVCKLNRLNNSIAFPYYKTINVFLTLIVSDNTQPSLTRTEYLELSDIVYLVDPLFGSILSQSIMIDHPSKIRFEYKRIATKHIVTVKIVANNLTFPCSTPNTETFIFNCLLNFPSGIYWPGYASIYVAGSFFQSFPLQANPYPIFHKTEWHNFPGYSVPFHFIGQYYNSFQDLKVNIKLANVTKPIELNCTVVSDSDIYCKFDSFPGKLPAFGNFVFYSHSNPLTLPNLSVNLNLPPAITSAVYSANTETIKISTSNYFTDYLLNTNITAIQCKSSCTEYKCDQIVFNYILNILTCKIKLEYGNKSTEWVSLVEIGSHRLNIVLTAQEEKKSVTPKIISSFKFSIITLLALSLLLILGLGIYYLRKEIDRFKLATVSTKFSDAHRTGSRKVASMSRLDSATKISEIDNPEMLTNQFAFFTKRM